MASTTSTVKSTKIVKTAAEIEQEFLAEREKDVRKKHRRVLPGTIRREMDGPHAGKITVEMRCQNGGCEAIRRVATSDLFQVRFCQECTVTLRKKRRAKASKEAKASKDESKEVKEATKEVKAKKPRRKKAEVPSFAASNGAAHGVVVDEERADEERADEQEQAEERADEQEQAEERADEQEQAEEREDEQERELAFPALPTTEFADQA